MYEKISEKEKRIEKVQKVKDKILAEIESQLEKYKNEISEQDIPNDSYEFCIKESFALFRNHFCIAIIFFIYFLIADGTITTRI